MKAIIALPIFLCMFTTCTCQKFEKIPAVLKETPQNVTFRCHHTCSGIFKWTYGEELVIQCEGNHCKEGLGFENRVQTGNNCDLIISRLQYNDQGFYYGTCDDQYFNYQLEVLMPVVVSVFAGDRAHLPCYAATKPSRSPYNSWKKDDEQMLLFQNGNFSYEPKLKGRVSASEERYKTGDYSMRITKVLPSDQGLYRCECSETGDHGYSVLLNVQVKNHALQIKVGDSLTLPITDLAEVTLTRAGHSHPEVMRSVKGGKPQCSPKYDDKNNMLTLTHFSLDDGGVYTVREEGEVVSIFNITAIQNGETQCSTTNIVRICIVASLVAILGLVIFVGVKWLSKRGHTAETSETTETETSRSVQSTEGSRSVQSTEAIALLVPEVDDSQLSEPRMETSSHSPLPWGEKDSPC